MYPVISSDLMAGAVQLVTCFVTLVAALLSCLLCSRA
jgi:hypothetical protein